MGKIVILDTDFILRAVKNNIDINTDIKSIVPYKCEIAVFDSTFDELKNKPLSKIAVDYIKKYKILKNSERKPVDELIIELVDRKKDVIIATQDRKLKEKLKKRKIPVITIRQQKYLVFL